MPLIRLNRLPWRCADGLERVSIKMHRNRLSETPITITSADGFWVVLGFFYRSSASTAHIGRSLSSPTQPWCSCTSAAPQQTSGTFVPEWQRGERMEEPANRSKANGRVSVPCYQGWLRSKVRACDHVHAVLLHSNGLQCSSIMTLISMIINVYPIKTSEGHICVFGCNALI